MKRILVAIILALVLGIALTGCAPANPLANTNWTLVELGGGPILADTSVTLDIAGGQISGRDGCNQYSAPITLGDAAFQINGPMISTLMACDQPIMEQADAFLAMLNRASTFQLQGEQLTLLDADGSPLAVFQAQP